MCGGKRQRIPHVSAQGRTRERRSRLLAASSVAVESGERECARQRRKNSRQRKRCRTGRSERFPWTMEGKPPGATRDVGERTEPCASMFSSRRPGRSCALLLETRAATNSLGSMAPGPQPESSLRIALRPTAFLVTQLSSTLADLGSVGEGIFHALPDMARNFDTVSARP